MAHKSSISYNEVNNLSMKHTKCFKFETIEKLMDEIENLSNIQDFNLCLNKSISLKDVLCR